ncbi:hypothetical protein [Thalassotalea profundi]|uniref:Uncharacterized protein n=1 Tax=Thalassotalea profundi TaxID=2036687 RepID=A0ABQ3J177_9GAMM|nr:hypothetical protein [Thalassotalea profundi]GHF00566.1 hypothetical protein GCM10011501_32510 [Thalassotalea profundi]
MQCNESQFTTNQTNERNYDAVAIEQQLAKAQEEIADLKSQIMWLERSYE